MRDIKNTDKCEMCRWYRNGLCIKSPPTIFKIDVMEDHHYYDTVWPYVQKDDFCGSFEKGDWRNEKEK